MNNNDILGLLGLAFRASRLSVGDDATNELLRGGKARAVFIASDAGAGILKKMERALENSRVPLLTLPVGKEELGGSLGRASCAVCATIDIGFAAAAGQKLAPLSEENATAAALLDKKNNRMLERRAKPRKKGAGEKVTTYIDIEEDQFRRKFGDLRPAPTIQMPVGLQPHQTLSPKKRAALEAAAAAKAAEKAAAAKAAADAVSVDAPHEIKPPAEKPASGKPEAKPSFGKKPAASGKPSFGKGAFGAGKSAFGKSAFGGGKPSFGRKPLARGSSSAKRPQGK